jgi:hypothetical protein
MRQLEVYMLAVVLQSQIFLFGHVTCSDGTILVFRSLSIWNTKCPAILVRPDERISIPTQLE